LLRPSLVLLDSIHLLVPLLVSRCCYMYPEEVYDCGARLLLCLQLRSAHGLLLPAQCPSASLSSLLQFPRRWRPVPFASSPAYEPPEICYLPQPNSYYHLSTSLGFRQCQRRRSNSPTRWRPREPSPFGSRWLAEQLERARVLSETGFGLGLCWERCPSCSRCNLRMSVSGRPFARGLGFRILPLLEFVGVSVARSCGRVLWGGNICCGVHGMVCVHRRMTAFRTRLFAILREAGYSVRREVRGIL
jgi:hypothetical protein